MQIQYKEMGFKLGSAWRISSFTSSALWWHLIGSRPFETLRQFCVLKALTKWRRQIGLQAFDFILVFIAECLLSKCMGQQLLIYASIL
jgi:hypothetical protein